MAERTLEFFFDYGSPFSYLADTQLPALAARTGARVVYRPMLLGGVFKAVGNRSPAFETVEPKRAYGGRDMRRWIDRYGAPFQPPEGFPVNTLQLMRTAVAAQREGVFARFHEVVFPAFWGQGRVLSEPAQQAPLFEAAGLDAERLLALAQDPAVKQELKETTEEAVRRGVFGAPSFFVDGELFFGNDRLDWAERALAGNSR